LHKAVLALKLSPAWFLSSCAIAGTQESCKRYGIAAYRYFTLPADLLLPPSNALQSQPPLAIP